MRGLRLAIALSATLAAASPAAAQTVATSARPDNVAVTVYRAPNRRPEEPVRGGWLNGYALISETRTISIPAGASEIRFEGVAGGILPQSAIVSGLPEGVIERNYDAYLLSPASLFDRSLGRRVHLRRTTATGTVTEQEAVIRSTSQGGMVVETEAGIEALRCTGLREALIYPGVPAGLASRPTLSVRARSSRALTATVTLSYLASGFDWEANYVVHLSPAADRAELFAWLTVASGDETSFTDAELLAVAGQIRRESNEGGISREWGGVRFNCWPAGRTDQIAEERDEVSPPPPFTSPSPVTVLSAESIEVSGSRVARVAQIAQQEDLGDLKLYRLPERVTVASQSQKQVALLQRESVQVALVYRQRIVVNGAGPSFPATPALVTRNRTEEGLGLPLPAGRIAVFGERAGRPLLLGEGFIRDRAVGEEVEIELPTNASGVRSEISLVREGRRSQDFIVTVSNDRAVPASYELEMFAGEGERVRPERRLGRRNGHPLWAVTIPANSRASLRYRVYAAPESD